MAIFVCFLQGILSFEVAVVDNFSIITIGLSPAWDVIYCGERLCWGEHKLVSATKPQPAGKAMNISRALAWMEKRSIAAGLWGRDDARQLRQAMLPLKKLVKLKMTFAEGKTRQNVTIVDTNRRSEMHLRLRSELASKKSLRKLEEDLRRIVRRNSICVFAGLMPEGKFFGEILWIAESCRRRGAKIVVDTSGEALKKLVRSGLCWLIKPNVEELRELLGERVADNHIGLAKAGWKLLDKVEIVLISRGEKGAIVVTRKGAWRCRAKGRRKVLSTVGCGDYLLAGFLKGLKSGAGADYALQTAVQAATAKAWGWMERLTWQQVRRKIGVDIRRI
jgi:1-phosphofructokinase family hexose kinase